MFNFCNYDFLLSFKQRFLLSEFKKSNFKLIKNLINGLYFFKVNICLTNN